MTVQGGDGADLTADGTLATLDLNLPTLVCPLVGVGALVQSASIPATAPEDVGTLTGQGAITADGVATLTAPRVPGVIVRRSMSIVVGRPDRPR